MTLINCLVKLLLIASTPFMRRPFNEPRVSIDTNNCRPGACTLIKPRQIVCCDSNFARKSPPEFSVKRKMAVDFPDTWLRNCGTRRKQSTNSSRIIGGNLAYTNEFPWNVALFELSVNNERRLVCSGILISDRFFLTAAHCFRSNNYDSYRVGFGGNSLDKVEIEEIKNVYIHPKYNSEQFYDDISLVELKKPLKLTVGTRPVCLPHNEPDESSLFTVAGWGATNFGGSIVNKLLKINLNLVSTEKCNEKYFALKSLKIPRGIDRQFLCATNDDRSDSCQSDSGSGLIGNGKLIENEFWEGQFTVYGLVSFGYGCGSVDFPGVYVNVYRYVDWIIGHLKPQESAFPSLIA